MFSHLTYIKKVDPRHKIYISYVFYTHYKLNSESVPTLLATLATSHPDSWINSEISRSLNCRVKRSASRTDARRTTTASNFEARGRWPAGSENRLLCAGGTIKAAVEVAVKCWQTYIKI